MPEAQGPQAQGLRAYISGKSPMTMLQPLHMPAKVGIKSCRHAGVCVSFVYGCSYPAAIVFDQTHTISIG